MPTPPPDPEVDGPQQAVIRLELTAEQREVVRLASGLLVLELGYTPTEVVGTALLVAAVAGGHSSPATRRLCQLELTAAQSRDLAVVLGDAPTSWLVDADHVKIRYAEDWSALEPVPLGRRGLVVPATATESHPGKLVVRLAEPAPGADVFGTGGHTTTRLAAALVEEHLAPGDLVVDLGTGSGVLAVFAVLLGAQRVRALDTSAAAVEVATRTMRLNGVDDRTEVTLGELGLGGAPVDLLVANLLAGVLLDVMPRLSANVRTGGILITAGVVDARAGDIEAAARASDFDHVASSSSGGWTAAAFRRC